MTEQEAKWKAFREKIEPEIEKKRAALNFSRTDEWESGPSAHKWRTRKAGSRRAVNFRPEK